MTNIMIEWDDHGDELTMVGLGVLVDSDGFIGIRCDVDVDWQGVPVEAAGWQYRVVSADEQIEAWLPMTAGQVEAFLAHKGEGWLEERVEDACDYDVEW